LKDATTTRREVPVIIPRPEHNVSRANISKNALKVLYRLKESGYQSFLVGGGVRDLLLGRHPKDFDIATDAKPEDIRRLFRNCRLIGRRFRLAHVHFGREIIEVATFRGTPDPTEENGHETAKDAGGRILRDNMYGGIDEDVWRRDFTANALYYNIADFSIWDYTGGVADVRSAVMKLIGNPEHRYREDPVRMLRAVRFAAKLNFRIDKDSETPLRELGHLLEDMPASRLSDESLKMFLSGHGARSYELLQEYDLFRYLFPATNDAMAADGADTLNTLVVRSLENTDKRVAEGLPVTPLFLFGVLLWGPVQGMARELQDAGERPLQSLIEAADTVLRGQQPHVAIPKRYGIPMKEMMVMQLRFRRQHGKRALRIVDHPRFRAAFDFLKLRTEAGDEDPATVKFWSELEGMDADHRRAAVDPHKGRPRKRRRKPRRKPQE
jgi:poly(A) polymerase